MWNVTSLGGEEADLVHEVEKYQLDIVGPTTTNGMSSEGGLDTRVG